MLEGLKQSLSGYLTTSNVIKVVVALVIFIGVGIWSYHYYVAPKLDPTYVPNKEYLPENQAATSADTPAYLYFFYTTWCPHCKSARKPWDEIKEYISESGGQVNGITVNPIEVDCDKDSAKADEYNVTGYPTIKLDYGNSQFDYDASPAFDQLKQFLIDSLPKSQGH